MSELDQVKKIFLTEVDEETLEDNLNKINEWERNLRNNNAYLRWQEHGITQEINKLVREAYREHAITLAMNRSLDNEERAVLYAKQDACLFILGITAKDAKSELNGVLREIKHALNVTS